MNKVTLKELFQAKDVQRKKGSCKKIPLADSLCKIEKITQLFMDIYIYSKSKTSETHERDYLWREEGK